MNTVQTFREGLGQQLAKQGADGYDKNVEVNEICGYFWRKMSSPWQKLSRTY